MPPDRWQHVAVLCDSALSLEPARRPAFLDEACGRDYELREELEALLAYEQQAPEFLESPAHELAASVLVDKQPKAAPEPLPAGLQIGPYRIVAKIGSGGMGHVYKAADTRLERDVALKFLPTGAGTDSEALMRFQREARVVAALSHPNLCTLYDIGEHEGQPFLVMELLEGESLKERISAGPLPSREAIKLALQIADGLQAAHEKGVVHRDIKPGNIFITPCGQAKILDFGVAKLLSESGHASAVAPGMSATGTSAEATITNPGAVLGTVAYMSPEQARGEEVDVRTDIFSFGVTLYQTATGRLLVQDSCQAEVIPPRRLNPHLAPEFERVIWKALARSRSERYQSAVEMRAALARLATPRRPRWTAATGLVFAAIASTVIWAVLREWSPPVAPHVRVLTAFPGVEQFPAFSPDGGQVAFSWNGEDRAQVDLYRIPVTGGAPERLTNDADVECHPAWSPDAGSIAFFRCSAGTTDAMRETTTEVWVVELATGKKRRVADVSSPLDAGTAALAWTGDSRSLIVEDRPSINEPFGLFLLDLESGRKRRMTSPPAGSSADRSPALSPDGWHTLAFVRLVMYGVSDVYIVNLGPDWLPQSEPRRVTPQPAEITDLLWFGTKREILYAAHTGGFRKLWRISSSGGTPQPLVSIAPPGVHLAISGHGDQLAYTQGDTDEDIWRLDLNDKSDRTGRPFLCSNRFDQNPQISADGEKVVFDSDRSGNSEIWTADRDGSHVKQITSSRCAAGSPRWSPDGRQIAFDCNLDGNYEVFVVDATGGVPRRLTSDINADTLPNWSHDGRWIYFNSNRGGTHEIWKVPACGGRALQVTTGGGFGPSESPDGNWLYYGKSPNRPASLWRMPPAGGPESHVVSGLRGWNAFTVLPDGIYFRGQDNRSVQFFDPRTGHVSLVRDVTTRTGTGFTVAPGAGWMLFAAKQFIGGDLVIVQDLR